MKTGVFVDRKGQMATLSMKMGVFVDRVMKLMAAARKQGVFMAAKGKMTASARKRGVLWPEGRQTKKRHPRKSVSVYGVEQGGTVEKPWPPVAS